MGNYGTPKGVILLSWRNAGATFLTGKQPQVVAIVEDDPSMLTGIQRLLAAYGFMTEAFPSAEAFLERAEASEATCLLLDINLGGISGIELRRQLAASGSEVAVIFMTAVDDGRVEQEAVDAGCIAFLRKPFPARQLIEAIGKAASAA